MGNELPLDFDKLFAYSVIVFKSNGSSPFLPKGIKWILKFIILHSLFSIYMFCLAYTLLDIEDMKSRIQDTCSIAATLTVYVVVCFKYFVCVFYRAEFRILAKEVKEYYAEANNFMPENERSVIMKYALEGRKAMKFWLATSAATAVAFIGIPMFKTFHSYVKGEFEYIGPVKMAYPAVVHRLIPNEGILFWGTFSLWIYYIWYSVCLYLGLTPMGPIFILHACGRLEVLEMRMLKMFGEDGSETLEESTKKLKKLAIELQNIYEFANHLNVAVKLLYEITLKATSIILPVIAYVMIESLAQGEVSVDFVALFTGAILLVSLPCYYAEKLIEKSEDLREAVYKCGWERFYDRKTRSTLIILMTRMSRTVAIRSIFVTISLPALTEVFNQAYTLFNLLHAAWG